MDVSLLYTYRVDDPVRYQLEVLNPEAIVAGFVQGTLRDVVNTKKMDEVMYNRAEINQEVMKLLQEKEAQYGVSFVLVQIQSASPPAEVVTAIKDRMIAVQQQEQASAEAIQQRTLADSEFYTAQRKRMEMPTRSPSWQKRRKRRCGRSSRSWKEKGPWVSSTSRC